MSLEAAIRENTAALQALTAALSTGGARPQSVDKPAPVDASPTNNTRGAEEAAAVEQAKPALDYEKDVKPAVLRLAAKNKVELRAILDSYGVAKGSEVEAHNLPALLERIQASL